ncbi:Germin-like protein 9-3 [Morus notabilis]|uniref:Germin-like protein n=1 Tax=Morus notabilis TaxID=981085 RepID=W9RGX5_9ROSA|nr:germin-like protein 9-3 [Morus notabilis]EXB91220.1 Germin-like protein 9-3 [Morus notabilis]
MAYNLKTSFITFFSLLIISSFALMRITMAGDPNILTDFIVPQNLGSTNITGSFFTYTGLRFLFEETKPPTKFTASKVSLAEFPALNGQSVSYAVLEYPAGKTNPPHTHPRSAELLFVVGGCLEVGFVDTNNTLYTQSLQVGDIFVFPKGLVHFQYNADPKGLAFAVSAFGSANAGTVSLPNTLFATGIDDDVLAISFKTDVATIQKLKAGLAPKP